VNDGNVSHSSVTNGTDNDIFSIDMDEENWYRLNPSIMSDFTDQVTPNASHTRDRVTISSSLSSTSSTTISTTTAVTNNSVICGNQRGVQNHYAMPQFTGNLTIH